MSWFEHLFKWVTKEWPVLKEAKISVLIITLLAIGVGAYGGFRVSHFVLRERLETLQTLLEQERQKSKMAVSNKKILFGFGVVGGQGCFATVNLGVLNEFQMTYNTFVLCGLVDSTVDTETDTRTSLSPQLSIRLQIVSVSWPLSPEMSAGQDKLASPLKDYLRSQKIPESLGLTAVTNKWYEVVLLPKGARKLDVRSLSDIKTMGGKILSREGYDASGISLQ